MPPFSRVIGVAASGFLWLGVTGCGGSAPTTGETLNLKQTPEVAAAGKKVVQDFMEKASHKGQPRVKKPLH